MADSTSGEANTTESTDPGAEAPDTLGLPDELFVDRVRLYMKVMFFINVFFGAMRLTIHFAGVTPAGAESLGRSFVAMVVITALAGMVWFAMNRSRPPMRVAMGIEAVATLLLTAHYTRLVLKVSGDNDPTGAIWLALILSTIVLVLRSSLIPSPSIGTLLLGVTAVTVVVVSSVLRLPDLPVLKFVWLGAVGLVVVAVTTVTSSAIYGLQQEMRAAKRLGQYQLERRLGQGGMGQVFLARHSMLQRRTAVKLLTRSTSARARARFRREVQTASGLTHPNTIDIYDYGRTPEGAFYFAMEYVEGATLETIVRTTGPMPAARVLHLLRQAAGSLGEAHGRGLIHRDVKPQNIMICERGGAQDTVKVLDFGLVLDIATAVDADDEKLTGTPLYLAPEAIVEADGFVAESDVYALGAVAYFLLTGHPPFTGTLLDILSDHLSTEPEPLPRSEEVPALADLVMRCLHKDAGSRPPNASALLEELERCESTVRWSKDEAMLWWAEYRDIVNAGADIDGAGTLGSLDHLTVAP